MERLGRRRCAPPARRARALRPTLGLQLYFWRGAHLIKGERGPRPHKVGDTVHTYTVHTQPTLTSHVCTFSRPNRRRQRLSMPLCNVERLSELHLLGEDALATGA